MLENVAPGGVASRVAIAIWHWLTASALSCASRDGLGRLRPTITSMTNTTPKTMMRRGVTNRRSWGFMSDVNLPPEPRTEVTEATQPTDVTAQKLDLSKADRALPIPLHEQVAASIRRAIADGEARRGQRIPHAKDLAAVLGVNSNTVLRAIHLLRDEGLLEVGRGKAITIAGTPDQSALVSKIDELIRFAQSRGYGRPELLQMIEQQPEAG